jgi:hypothetical protein
LNRGIVGGHRPPLQLEITQTRRSIVKNYAGRHTSLAIGGHGYGIAPIMPVGRRTESQDFIITVRGLGKSARNHGEDGQHRTDVFFHGPQL